MKKLLTVAFIVMLMACICIGGALFVQATDGSGDPIQHTHDWTYDADTHIATCTVDNCDATCEHVGANVTRTEIGKHTIDCGVCGYHADDETCFGGVSENCTSLPVCKVCNNPYEGEYGEHTGDLKYDHPHEDGQRYHVLKYDCCGREVVEEHTAGSVATCLKKTQCSVCGLFYGEKNTANHDTAAVRTSVPASATHHKIVCACGVEVGTAEHRYDNACDVDCNDCGAERTPNAHVFSDWQIIKQPTNTTEGEQKRVCTVCEFTEKAAIAKLTDPAASGGSDDADGMKTSTVVIIIVAAVVVVAGGAVAAVLLIRKKKTQVTDQPEEQEATDDATEE